MLLIFLSFLPLAGCIAEQADLKQTEKNLQQRIKQSSEESAQIRARQSQEISSLREQELPQLRGELERALHQAQELQGKQEDLKQRMALLEKQKSDRLEELDAKLEPETKIDKPGLVERLDSLDVVIGTILLRMEELEKRLQALEKR